MKAGDEGLNVFRAVLPDEREGGKQVNVQLFYLDLSLITFLI